MPSHGLAVSDSGRAYDTADWPRWVDADRDSCDTRCEVLCRDSRVLPVVLRGRVISGEWLSPYTGMVLTDPAVLDVDHVVSTADAHRSGGWAWPENRRREYANDLTVGTLVAVERAVNRSKGGRGPEAWMPADHALACAYVQSYVRIKTSWGLTVTSEQSESIRMILESC